MSGPRGMPSGAKAWNLEDEEDVLELIATLEDTIEAQMFLAFAEIHDLASLVRFLLTCKGERQADLPPPHICADIFKQVRSNISLVSNFSSSSHVTNPRVTLEKR